MGLLTSGLRDGIVILINRELASIGWVGSTQIGIYFTV